MMQEVLDIIILDGELKLVENLEKRVAKLVHIITKTACRQI